MNHLEMIKEHIQTMKNIYQTVSASLSMLDELHSKGVENGKSLDVKMKLINLVNTMDLLTRTTLLPLGMYKTLITKHL